MGDYQYYTPNDFFVRIDSDNSEQNSVTNQDEVQQFNKCKTRYSNTQQMNQGKRKRSNSSDSSIIISDEKQFSYDKLQKQVYNEKQILNTYGGCNFYINNIDDENIVEIAESTFLSDKQLNQMIRVKFFIRSHKANSQSLPRINGQVNFKKSKLTSYFQNLSNINKKQNFCKIIGWIFPANLKDLKRFHDISQQLNNNCLINKSNNNSILTLISMDTLRKHFELSIEDIIYPPHPFIPKNFQNDFYLSDMWHLMYSQICFIYYKEDINESINIGFQYIEEKPIKLVQNVLNLQQRLFRKNQMKKRHQQHQQDQ